MGVYIPNMEKPKGCRWCPLNHDSICYVIQPYKTDETNGKQCRNDCPLIEIVTCKDCRYNDGTDFCEFYYMSIFPTDFCSYGERRADETQP